MLLWIESFDIYGTGATGVTNMLEGVYAAVGGTGSGPSTAQARTGVNSFLFNSSAVAGSIRRVFGANKTQVGVGFAQYMDSLPNNSTGMVIASFLDNSAAPCCSVTVSTTGQVEIRSGGFNGTVRASSAPCLVTTAWQHIEIRVSFSNTVGACEIRVNGVTVLNASNINTDLPNGGYAAQVRVGDPSVGTLAATSWYIDDYYAWDTSGSYNNSFIGDKKVYVILPSADTAVADWTPDTGTVGFSRINEIPPVSASYIQGTVVGDVSEFAMTNLPADITNILGLQFYTKMLKTDAGASSVQMAVVSGASSANGADRPITTNATVYMDVFEQDPDTAAPWTLSGVDAILTRATRTL